MNKNIIIILAAALFALGAFAFNYYQKETFNKKMQEFTANKQEILYIKELQRVWSAKKIKSKIYNALQNISNNKKKIELKRKKAAIYLKNLSDKEINKALSKLASLPLHFVELKLNKNGENFNMECKCVW